MEQGVDADENNKLLCEFKNISNEYKNKIVSGKDKHCTQKATRSAVGKLKKYLKVKGLPNLKAIKSDTELPQILLNFYVEIKPKNDNHYAVQSLKCIRAALNRYFKVERGIDIIKDPQFIRPNEMFRGVCVQSKKQGKGAKKPTPKISPRDLIKIGEYFNHDYMNSPDPKKLQQNLLFFVIYYFCRWGCENLYDMKKTISN